MTGPPTVTEMKTLTIEALADRLAVPADTLILMHRNPDGDAVGSAFALREFLVDRGCRAWCICEGELPERLRFLANHVQDSVLLSSVPFDTTGARVISVDVASPSQLGGLRERFEAHTDLMIDHHATGTPFADHYINGHAAATGEILFDLFRLSGRQAPARVFNRAAAFLYAAISSDTGCFRYSNVTPDTHRRAAELVACGIDCAEINHRLFDSKSMGQLRAEAMGALRLQVFHGGRMAVIAFGYADRQAAGLSDCDLETLIDVARSLAGVEVAVTVRQPSDADVFRVSTRSAGSYNVAALCARFGGGGHEKAAGCTLTAPDIDSAVAILTDAVKFPDER